MIEFNVACNSCITSSILLIQQHIQKQRRRDIIYHVATLYMQMYSSFIINILSWQDMIIIRKHNYHPLYEQESNNVSLYHSI